MSIKRLSPTQHKDLSSHTNTVPAGYTDIYTKSGSVYKKVGTIELKLMTESDDSFTDLKIGSSYAESTIPENSIVVQNKVGIGTDDPLVGLHCMTGFAFKHVNISGTYNTTSADMWLSGNSGDTINLHEPASGSTQNQVMVIKNAESVTGNVTVGTQGSSTIDGNSTITLTPSSSVILGWQGSNWRIIGYYAGGTL